jgi:hypothetical protein
MALTSARRVDQAIAHDWAMRVHANEGRLVDEEIIATFFTDLGLFRWWWATREEAVHMMQSRLDEAFAHAQRVDLQPLLTRQHQLDDDTDAEMLCRIAAYFSNAVGMRRVEAGTKVTYLALFEPKNRVSAANIMRTIPPPPVAPVAIVEKEPEVRQPSRELLLPLVYVASTIMRAALHDAARTALLVVIVDTSRDKARFYVTLVASTQDGDLLALDSTRELLDATAAMLVEDAKSGNGRWRKLAVRIDCEGQAAAIRRCEVSP